MGTNSNRAENHIRIEIVGQVQCIGLLLLISEDYPCEVDMVDE